MLTRWYHEDRKTEITLAERLQLGFKKGTSGHQTDIDTDIRE